MSRRNWKAVLITVVVVLVSTVAAMEYRRIYILNDRLGCVATWLDDAKALHTLQMKEPANFTGDTMRKLMDSVDRAYACATKGPSSGHAPGAGSFGQHGDMPPHK